MSFTRIFFKKITSAVNFREPSASPKPRKDTAHATELYHAKTKAGSQPENPPQSPKTRPLEKADQLEKAVLDKAEQSKQAKREAQARIDLSPTSPQTYFILAKIYEEGNLIEAWEIFKAGIHHVPSSDRHHKQLQKKMNRVSATITRWIQKFRLVPNEIWELTFRYLDPDDLHQCWFAFDSWAAILRDKPGFYEAFRETIRDFGSGIYLHTSRNPPELEIYKVDNRRLTQRLTLDEKLMILSSWKNNIFHKLTIDTSSPGSKGYISTEALTRLYHSIGPSLKEVVFSDAQLHAQDVMETLQLCSNVERVTFIRVELLDNGKYDRMFIRPTQLSCLTYIMLSFTEVSNGLASIRRNFVDELVEFLTECPNLSHSILANSVDLHAFQSYCIEQVLQRCSQIKTLAITFSGSTAIKSIIDDVDYYERKMARSMTVGKSSTQGLRTFIHHVAPYQPGYKDTRQIFRQHCKTLEYLKLFYDGVWVSTDSLYTLIRSGAPYLRELHLYTFRVIRTGYKECKPVYQLLYALISRCPSLRVLTIDFNEMEPLALDPTFNNDQLLMLIVRRCRLLSHLKLKIKHVYDENTMIYFAALVGPDFTYIYTYMTDPARAVIKAKIESLINSPTALVHEKSIVKNRIYQVWADTEDVIS